MCQLDKYLCKVVSENSAHPFTLGILQNLVKSLTAIVHDSFRLSQVQGVPFSRQNEVIICEDTCNH